MDRKIETTCIECNTTITIDFTGLDYSQAKKAIQQIDKEARECPGFHVEIGGWKRLWQLEDAVERAYTAEEKAQCHDTLKHIVINFFTRNSTHQVENEKALLQFLEGYCVDNPLKKKEPVYIAYENHFGELIGEIDDHHVGEVIELMRKYGEN
jgi:hypothetical protein